MSDPVSINGSSDQNDQTRAIGGTLLLPAERQQLIVARVGSTGRVKVEELALEFGVSVMTIRRDLALLERDGQIRRVHGGALLPSLASHEDSFSFRLEKDVEAKARLAEAAVARLEEEESVFVDGSTTAYMAAQLIVQRDLAVTVLTNSLSVMALFNRPETRRAELIAIGGSFRPLTQCFGGPRAAEIARGYLADKALLSCKGVTERGQITEPTASEAEIKQVMIEQAREPMLLVDGPKLGSRGLCVVGSVSQLETVFVAGAPEERIAGLRESGVEVVVV